MYEAKYCHLRLFHIGYFSLFTRMDRAAQHALEIDAKDKHHAQGLDDRMQSLRNGSAGIGFYPGIESIDNT